MKFYPHMAINIIFCVFAGHVFAQGSPILGGGNAPCSALIEKNSFFVTNPNMQWFAGYLSGAAALDKSHSLIRAEQSKLANKLDELDMDSLVLMAKNHCQLYPSDDLYQIANRWITIMNTEKD